jgi:hypothetical protein
MTLTQAEDADLRRLAAFHDLGFLRHEATRRYAELRRRDRRANVRPVTEMLVRAVPFASSGDGTVRLGRPCLVYPR